MSARPATGFFGKLPSHGDFLSRRLPRAFLDPWDAWLQEAITESRRGLDTAWLDAYLVSPVWRFCLSAGLCGPDGWAGLLMPSVDRVGRYFPLTVARLVPAEANPFEVPGALQAWYAAAEALMLAALEDGFDLPGWDAGVEALDTEGDMALGLVQPAGPPSGADPWRVDFPAAQGPARAYPVILHRLARGSLGGYSLWWTSGAEHFAPCVIAVSGLPAPRAFAGFLTGRWGEGPRPAPETGGAVPAEVSAAPAAEGP